MSDSDWDPPMFSEFKPEYSDWKAPNDEEVLIEVDMNTSDVDEHDHEDGSSFLTCASCFNLIKVNNLSITKMNQLCGNLLSGCYLNMDINAPISEGKLEQSEKCVSLCCNSCDEVIAVQLDYTCVFFNIVAPKT